VIALPARLRTARDWLARAKLARAPGVLVGRHVDVGRGVRAQVLPGAELRIGDGCRIGERVRLVVHGGRVELGAGVTLGERCTIVAHAGVTIGTGARLDEGAVIVDFNHVIDDVEVPIRTQPLVSAPVVVGANARVGLGASILSGVCVGDAAQVGPHAVVTRDVAPGGRVGGVPARSLAVGERT
jgi:acetyltransferase-like isoleucine patch superfamily enzyme